MGMTREEEIKSRATRYGVKYVELDGSLANLAEGDMTYLLARNEELQRRVDALTDAAKRCSYHVAKRMNDLADTEMGEHYGPFKEVRDDYVALMNAIDAKEQDDD